MNRDHHQLVAVLLKYLPSALAESSLDRALEGCKLTRHSYEARHLQEVIAKLDPSIRVFVATSDQPKLRADLRALLGRRTQSGLSLTIASEPDIGRARLLTRRICMDLALRVVVLQKCITIVSELARNIVSYTPGGTIDIEVDEGTRVLRIRARDRGTGIGNLDEVLGGTYQSKTGLGKGILGVKRLAQNFTITTGAVGTEIRVEVSW